MPRLRAHNQQALGGQQVGTRRKHSPSEEDLRRAAIYEAFADLGDVIYAIACPDGLIKIGFTTRLLHRRQQHGAAFEDILAIKPGTYEEEQQIHHRLQAHVAKGQEYYHPHPDILDFVNEIRSRAGIPLIGPTDLR